MNYLKSVYKIYIAVLLLYVSACSTPADTKEKELPKAPLTYTKEIRFKGYFFGVNDFLPCEDEGFFIVGKYDTIVSTKTTIEMLTSAATDTSTGTACIMKLARDSTILWTKKFPHPKYASSFTSIVRGDGNKLYLLKNNYINTFLAKGYEIIQIDGDGKEYSRRSYGETLSINAEKMKRLPDGDFIVAGERSENLTEEIGFKLYKGKKYTGVGIAPSLDYISYQRISSEGKIKWEHELPKFRFDDLETGPGKYFYIRGFSTYAKGGLSSSYVLLAFDQTSGDFIWKKELIGFHDLDSPFAVLPDSTIVVFQSPKNGRGTNYKRYASDGKKIKEIPLGIEDSYTITSAMVAGSGGIICCGTNTRDSICLCVLNPDGSVKWIKTFAVEEPHPPYCYEMSDKRIAMRLSLWDEVEHKPYLKLIVTDEFGNVEAAPDSSASVTKDTIVQP